MVLFASLKSAYVETPDIVTHVLAKRDADDLSHSKKVVFGVLIPILVILSGVFAGLTLGYMSLDETQLTVLATSGTEKQKRYAAKIIPIRKNGHLLLITLILANMIVNETLPVIADPVFNGGIKAVVVSTALIVIFAEIIPQTVCTRYGLVIGAKMAFFVQILIVIFWVIAFPVSKLLEWILGPHHGIIYRRSELKELIAMHADDHPQGQGGELKHDTAAIIGHTLDLQEKVVKDAMTPISKVFMLSIDSVLDYATLTKIHRTGHSRIPVYIEIEVPTQLRSYKTEKVKKIIGILLVKQCVLLDPEDATPLKSIPLNKVPPIACDEPLLNVLDRFQEGRSHMAIVSRMSSKRAASVKETIKPALTRRFLNRFRDSDSSGDEDLEMGNFSTKSQSNDSATVVEVHTKQDQRILPAMGGIALEQTMPADALLPKANADKLLQGLDQYTNPMGIITLEDVLEELIGEEIYDEFDLTGPQALPASSYVPPEAAAAATAAMTSVPNATLSAPVNGSKAKPSALKVPIPKMTVPTVLGGLGILRSRSAPGTPRGGANISLSSSPIPGTPSESASNDKTVGKNERLDHIKEVNTPSPTERVISESGAGSLGSGPNAICSESVFEQNAFVPQLGNPHIVEPLPAYGINQSPVERIRASSQPPSPRLQSTLVPGPITSVTQNLNYSLAQSRTGSPAPSMLTEAVLRGRQARLAAAGVHSDVQIVSTIPRSGAKGRFKSTRLDNAATSSQGAPPPSRSNAFDSRLQEVGPVDEDVDSTPGITAPNSSGTEMKLERNSGLW